MNTPLSLNTCAPRRLARSLAAQLWLSSARSAQGAEAAPGWDDLATLPAWVLELQARPATHQRLAMAAGSLWHAPALRRCLDASVLQRLAEALGAPTLSRLLETEPCGPAQALPTEEAGLVPAVRHMGQLLMLAALPDTWRGVLAPRWGWESVAAELATLPASDGSGQRAFQRAERVCAAAWEAIAGPTDPAPAAPPHEEPPA